MAAVTFTKPKQKLTWLITGCSSGFGLYLTRAALAGGHRVIATSRNPSRTPDLVVEVERLGGKWISLDVTSPSSKDIVDELENSGEEIDVLVNNAGGSIHAPFETYTESEIREQLELLYFGPVRLIQAVLPYMRKRRYGVVTNISSGASISGQPSMSVYASAKAAIDGLSRVLTKEVAEFNIRILTVVMGGFRTSMASAAQIGQIPVPDDYKESTAVKLTQAVTAGTWVPDGDPEKAMKALYEVVVGEGVGKGKESEGLLLLGADMVPRFQMGISAFTHALEVFEPVATSVSVDK